MHTESFIVEGGNQLSGVIRPQGAKNEVLQILSAVLLTDQPVTIHNIPDILDVRKMISLLRGLGVRINKKSASSFTFQAIDLDLDYLFIPKYSEDVKKIRGSVMLIGALLVRFKNVDVGMTVGEKIRCSR